jgi:hypothetical protein
MDWQVLWALMKKEKPPVKRFSITTEVCWLTKKRALCRKQDA